jgi:hypothetical protein
LAASRSPPRRLSTFHSNSSSWTMPPSSKFNGRDRIRNHPRLSLGISHLPGQLSHHMKGSETTWKESNPFFAEESPGARL